MAKKKKSIEIVIPIYNEEEELETSVRKLHQYLAKNLSQFSWHITIADNASTDKSLLIAGKLSRELTSVAVIHLAQKGRGRAVRQSWQKSSADYLSYMDVDLSTDLRSLPKLFEALEEGFDIAIGSRLLSHSKVVKRPLKREILSRGYNIIIKFFFGVNFSDAQCGFKAVRKEVVEKLIPKVIDNAWFFDSEMLIIGEKMGYRIYEEPVIWIDNPGSTVRVLRTVSGDIRGLVRLYLTKPWEDKNI